jgi:hypothetical protein
LKPDCSVSIGQKSAFGIVLFSMLSCGVRQPTPVLNGDVVAHEGAEPSETPEQTVEDSKAGGSTDTTHEKVISRPPPMMINDEIVPVLDPIPPPLSDPHQLPEDPTAIREEVSRLLADDKRSDALPMIDVLLILNPADLEMMETRGRILVGQGFLEDGATDLHRCCHQGRQSCCQ